MTLQFLNLIPSKLKSKILPGGSVASAAAMITDDRSHFEKWRDDWVDSHRHGAIKRKDRYGYALSRNYMRGLAAGLLMPHYTSLRREDIPESLADLNGLLHRMIAATPLKPRQPEIPTAIRIATKNLGYTDLADHALALWELRKSAPELYELAVRGDFASAKPAVQAIQDLDERDGVVRTLARHRIIWGIFDVHRVAALKEGATRSLTPWFMRPFTESYTANEYIALTLQIGSAIGRVNKAADRAEDFGRKKVRLHGPQGKALEVAIPISKKIESHTSESHGETITSSRHQIDERAKEIMNDLQAVADDPERNNKQSLFEHHFYLCEVAGLFFTSYRFAEDEGAMLRVIENPRQCEELFRVQKRPMPRHLDPAAQTRARHIVAAYRPAVLNDSFCAPYHPNEIIAAEVSEAKAHALLLRLATANTVSDVEKQAGWVFDLSHDYRTRGTN